MPDLHEIASGKLPIQEIKDIDIGDLLGRDSVTADSELLELCITRKVVMVTGAGGSIGSELCRQILKIAPDRLILLDHSEFNLYTLEEELHRAIARLGLAVDLVPVLGSVNDPAGCWALCRVMGFRRYTMPQLISTFPLLSVNIAEGIRNNILGTVYTAQAAVIAGVERFVLVSSDKAVRPTNIMGASKRMSELALQP